jgi:hypothetical protein
LSMVWQFGVTKNQIKILINFKKIPTKKLISAYFLPTVSDYSLSQRLK